MTLAGEIGGKDLLYLDDLQVGQRFTSKTHRVDEAQIKAFASQFDPQPFHLDENAAKDSLFSGLVASGWHTAAMTMRLLVEGLPLAGGLIGAGGELSWPQADQAWRHPARRKRGSGDHPLSVAAGSRGRVDAHRHAQSARRSGADPRGQAGRAAPSLAQSADKRSAPSLCYV